MRQLREVHGPLMFHQSGGCCDGSAPMCYPRGEFAPVERTCCSPSSTSTCGRTGGFWMSRSQYEVWSHTRLIVDVVSGPRQRLLPGKHPKECVFSSVPASPSTR
ncbi:DUF779 domain-containing protein [Streptomyces sp. T1317-0309]|nr:DUF779 domain-containing protein [Streptomyces sp. T1317-0309]